jgi:multidrug efflux system membrane fusion protein
MRDRRPRCIAGTIGIAIVISIVSNGCKKAQSPAPPPPATVTVARPIEREVIEWDDYTGHLEAVETVEVRARVSGFIESVSFLEGSIVKKGDLLLTIDPALFKADFDRAKAQVAQAESQVSRAQGEFKRAEQAVASKAISQEEYETRKFQLLSAQAALTAAQAAAETARLNLDYTKVVAPIAGRTSRAYVTAGNLINGGSGQTTVLTTITSIDPMYAYVDVDEQSVLKYQRLAQEKKRVSARESKIPIFMRLSSETGFPHEGLVDFVDNRVDPQTGNLRARGVFSNPPPGYLTPGFFVRVRIPGSGRYKTLLIPDLSIGTDQDQRFVLIVGGDNTVERRVVKLGALFGRYRSVEEGLHPDDRVIINGTQRARPGAKVNPQETQLNVDEIPRTAPNSAATQSLPTTRRLPTPHSVPVTAPTTTGAGQ